MENEEKNIVIKNNDFAVTYQTKFKETPIAQGLVKHGKEKLVDKILANFYFIARKNGGAVGKWEKASVVEALTKACQYELIPDGVQAALIPYGNNLTFQPMYQGLLEIAYRTGIFKSISANIVYEGDSFDYDLGADCFVNHKIDLVGERSRMLAVYADIKLATGGRIVRVMTQKEVLEIRNKAKNKNIWSEYFDAMATKTVIKQAFKFCPKSEVLSDVVRHDNELEQDFSSRAQIDTTKATELNQLFDVKGEQEKEI